MRCCLILEEFGPDLVYVPGENNAAADALSRLETLPSPPLSTLKMAELFAYKKQEDLPDEAFPLSYKLIMQEQLADQELLTTAEAKDGYVLTKFQGGGKQRTLITKDGK